MGFFKKLVRKIFGGGHKHVYHDNSAQQIKEAERKVKEDFETKMREIQSQDIIERQRIEAQLRQDMIKQVEQEFARIVQIREEEVKRFEMELKREIEEQQKQYRIDAQALQVELGQYCIDFDALQFEKKQDQIESGASGTVYKGKYNGQFVAIKVYHGEADSDDTIHNLKHEVNVMKGLDHENIVKFVGITVEPKVSLVMEFVDGCDLNKYLHFKKKVFSTKEAIAILHQIAVALEYLHSKNIVHGDIKSANVVMYGANKVKLTDFGISTILKNQSNLTTTNTRATSTRYGNGLMTSGASKSQNTLHTLQRVGTPVYMAKEMFNTNVKKLSSEEYKKVDIYAFGILMYEILSGQVPFFEKHFSDMYELRRYVKNGGRPCVDPGWLQSIIVLMEDCWEENANNRPCFKPIAQTLQRMMNSNDQEVLNWYEQQPKSNSATKEQRQPSTSAPQPVVLHAQFDDDYELALALQRSMVEM